MQGIYLIRCNSENKVYIGQSKNIKDRYYKHTSLLNNNKHPNRYLQTAFNRFGKETFSCEILYETSDKDVSQKELYDLEIYYISLYNSNNRTYGYNIESGGNSKGRIADETRLKLSESLKGRVSPCYWKGKKMPKELRDRLSNMRKGKASHWKGKKQTQDHIKKRTSCQYGRVWVNNGIDSRFVTEADAQKLINQGFVMGRPFFKRVKGKKYLYKGEMYTISQISQMCGIGRCVLIYRLNNGWDMEKSTTTPVKK